MLDSFISFQTVMILWHLPKVTSNVLKNQHTLIFDVVEESQMLLLLFFNAKFSFEQWAHF